LASAAPRSVNAADLDTLATWMTGSFSSRRQAAADSSYFDIRLEMVRIWKDRKDGYWLYVEQAAAGNLGKPYRQRVYHLTALREGFYKSVVYAIPDPLRFAGEWQNEAPLALLSPDSLQARGGCDVVLQQSAPGEFAGGTVGRSCESSLRGAAFATSEVTIRRDRIESWDRGFDESGTQVWGAEKGPYVFVRQHGPATAPPD
jgi:hypothetical protein